MGWSYATRRGMRYRCSGNRSQLPVKAYGTYFKGRTPQELARKLPVGPSPGAEDAPLYKRAVRGELTRTATHASARGGVLRLLAAPRGLPWVWLRGTRRSRWRALRARLRAPVMPRLRDRACPQGHARVPASGAPSPVARTLGWHRWVHLRRAASRSGSAPESEAPRSSLRVVHVVRDSPEHRQDRPGSSANCVPQVRQAATRSPKSASTTNAGCRRSFSRSDYVAGGGQGVGESSAARQGCLDHLPRRGALVHRPPPAHSRRQRRPACGSECSHARRPPWLAAAQGRVQARGARASQRIRVARINDIARPALIDKVERGPRERRSDEWKTARSRLEQNHAERVVQRREREGVSSFVDVGQFGLVDEADELDRLDEPKLRRQRAKRRLLGPRTDDHEPDPGFCRAAIATARRSRSTPLRGMSRPTVTSRSDPASAGRACERRS